MLLAKGKTLRNVDPFKIQSRKYKSRQAWVYVLACEDGYYYVGFSRFLHNRLKMHFMGIGAFFTRLHRPLRLISFEKVKSEVEEFQKWTSVARQYGFSKVGGFTRSSCRRDGLVWPFAYETRETTYYELKAIKAKYKSAKRIK